jgi:hypothetical protein
MNEAQKAFVQGFVKRAAEYGFDENEAAALLDKTAAVGMLADLAAFGAPSGLGAMIGGNYSPVSNKELEEELRYSEDPSISKALKYMLVPGYTGYRLAKNNRLEHAYDKYRQERQMQEASQNQ